jgi:hypothetical protein
MDKEALCIAEVVTMALYIRRYSFSMARPGVVEMRVQRNHTSTTSRKLRPIIGSSLGLERLHFPLFTIREIRKGDEQNEMGAVKNGKKWRAVSTLGSLVMFFLFNSV